jgi:two-component system cell cycle sensor histidine kinase/response regulator CckA
VLVVDDHELMRRMLVELLEGAGHAVVEAASGADALKLSTETDHPLDLLVTDISMPAMNGRELADQMRRQRPSIRVLFTSGFPQGAHGTSVLGEAESYLVKPFTIDGLEEAVRELLDRPVGATIERLDDDGQ